MLIDEGEFILLGEDLRRKIDEGLAFKPLRSVLSPSFFDKRWTQWELDNLTLVSGLNSDRNVYPAHPSSA